MEGVPGRSKAAYGTAQCAAPANDRVTPEGDVPDLRLKMVLPVRIELTTSALPRMRSTTELRQHEPFADLLLQQGRAYGLG